VLSRLRSGELHDSGHLNVVDAPAIRAETVFAINPSNLADGDEDQTLRTSLVVSRKDRSVVTSEL
jgi:hypothetical protein